MAWVSIPEQWSGVDVSKAARAWRSIGSSESRVVTSARAVEAVATAANHLCARQPRTTFWQYTDPSSAYLNDADATPLFSHYYTDDWPNGQVRSCAMLVIKRKSATWNSETSWGYAESNFIYGKSPLYSETTSSHSWPQDLSLLEFGVVRNAEPGTAVEEVINARSGLRIVDIVEQDVPLQLLDTTVHACATAYVGAGMEIIDGPTESIRNACHQARQYNLPIEFQWHACKTGSDPETVWSTAMSSSDPRGLYVNGDGGSYLNPLDTSETQRTAWSPGFSVHGYKAGRGLSNSAPLRVYVLATTVGGNATINVVGPDHRASNWTTLEITPDSPVEWQDCGVVYLNTLVDDTCTNTARNKFDVLCLPWPDGDQPSSNVIVYGIVAQREYA